MKLPQQIFAEKYAGDFVEFVDSGYPGKGYVVGWDVDNNSVLIAKIVSTVAEDINRFFAARTGWAVQTLFNVKFNKLVKVVNVPLRDINTPTSSKNVTFNHSPVCVCSIGVLLKYSCQCGHPSVPLE